MSMIKIESVSPFAGRSRRSKIPAIVGAVAGLVLLWNAWSYYATSKSLMVSSQRNLADCEKLVSEIRQLSRVPAISSADSDPPDMLAGIISQAAIEADLSPLSIASVSPQSVSQLGGSSYSSRSTEIALKNLSLLAFATFARNLENLERGISIRDLQLDARGNTGPGGEEMWDGRLTLTQVLLSTTNPKGD